MSSPVGDFGLIGLAVMGQNLILNMADHGFTVVAFNRTVSKVDHFLENEAKGKSIVGAHSVEEFVSKLKTPRRIMLLVMAGKAVDDFIATLLPHLEAGDIVIDGGNSHYPDTNRRCDELAAKQIRFVGCGVSGGEEGARYGPSLMPGGNKEAWPYIKDIFQAIAADDEKTGEPCCDWVGDGGAGHFVKMVHNGIEYGDMQLICEAYDFMKTALKMDTTETGDVFNKWNKGVLDSYLVKITGEVMSFAGPDGKPLLDRILDAAGQKGTGKWTAISALQLNNPSTLVNTAVAARSISHLKSERQKLSETLKWEPVKGLDINKEETLTKLEQAVYASKIMSYTQGFMLLRSAAEEYKWELHYSSIARMWRGGCIIKSVFLNDIANAFDKNTNLESLVFDDFFNKALGNAMKSWVDTTVLAIQLGVATPVITGAHQWLLQYSEADSPANLIQALRDYFGAHTFRIRPGAATEGYPEGKDIHANWTGQGGNVSASTYNA